jgi:sec-independent protein translocase protein TatC
MTENYPPESQHLDFIGHLEELRRRILISLLVLAVTSLLLFFRGQTLMQFVIRPLANLTYELIFISPTEVFVSFIKVSLLAGFIVSFPIILYQCWAFLAPAVARPVQSRVALWLSFALLCFLGGVVFSYTVAVPAALRFLLSFGEGIATAQITLARYVSFFVALILVGGAIFEIPIIMGLLADIGFLKTEGIKGKRGYSLLVILIVAAVITPTQDIVNMLIFALPMYLLFELGIVLVRIIEKNKLNRDSNKG